MRIDRKKQEELMKRKGNSTRTIIQGVWLIISFVASYFIVTTLMSQGFITYSLLYSRLSIPRSVPSWVLLGALMFFVVVLFQFFLAFGFFISDPQGRRRLGDPSIHSRNKDPFDNERGR